ncbi:hypothetical protein M0R45_029475 [Rubus argutus]|uniref:Uncharacterized protein n=1 Tax=Rubus argutus TaxID=59490 RepID=A0AAW1WAU7_RUBAR
MASQEHNSGIMQWALSLLDGDSVYNPVQYGDMIQHDTNDIYRGTICQRVNMILNLTMWRMIEIIAYTLQKNIHDYLGLELRSNDACSSYS